MPEFQDDVYLGPLAVYFQQKSGAQIGSSPMERGIGPVGRVFVVDYIPTTLAATAICLAQAIAGAANAVINGALAVAGVANVVEPFGRTLQYVSSNAGDTTQLVTVTGTDFLGNPMTERVTLNGTVVVQGRKAFDIVNQVAVSAVMAGNLSVGTADKFGMPVLVQTANDIAAVKWADALAMDAGTFTVADVTDPATNLTNDTRGVYAPTSASNGARRLTMTLPLKNIHLGPSAVPFTAGGRTGAFGITPV